MANQPFDREVINVRERPLSSDVNLLQSYESQAMAEFWLNLFASKPSLSDASRLIQPPPAAPNQAGFLGDGFQVKATSPATLSVLVSAGYGLFNDNTTTSAIGGVTGVNDQSVLKPLSLTVNETINVPAADPVNPRIDIVEVIIDRRLADPTSRDVLDVGTGQFVAGLVNKTLTYNQNGRSTVNGIGSINYKTGTPAGVPVAPATSVGYAKISEIRIDALAATVAANRIQDLRRMLFPGGLVNLSYGATSGGGVAALIRAVAPSGIRAGVVFVNNVTVDFYIMAGNTSLLNLNSTQIQYDAVEPGPISPFPGAAGLTLITATVGIQTSLAAATPALAVAVGQPLVFAQLANRGVGAIAGDFRILASLQY